MITEAAAPAVGVAVAFEQIVDAMRDPSFYPDAPDAVDVHETHISWVFLAGERAYKLKKPLVLPFLDYGSVERRRELRELEVALNRRLAGDLYIGVRAIAICDGRPRLLEHVLGDLVAGLDRLLLARAAEARR